MQQVIHLALGKANPERMNGVNKVVHFLAQAQAHAGMNVSVWGITKEYQDHNYPDRNFTTKLFPTLTNRFAVSANLKAALLELDGNSVLHIHGGFIPEFFGVARFVKRHIKIPIVLTSHGAYNLVALKKSNLRKRIYYTFFEQFTIKNSSLIHLLGPSEVNGFKSFTRLTSFPVVCVPNGQTLTTDTLITSTPPPTPFIITFCGRMDLYTKGLDIMLKAFSTFLKNIDAPAEFKIIGDGQDTEAIKKLAAELGVADNVIFTGSKFGKEKDDLIRNSHVFLHTSRNEGVPMAVLEAASFGVPVIISEETNLGSYVKQFKAGWCLPRNVVEELTIALTDVYTSLNRKDQSYDTIKQNSFKMIKEALNWNSLALKWKEIYGELA